MGKTKMNNPASDKTITRAALGAMKGTRVVLGKSLRSVKLFPRLDMALEWVTERIDRRLTAAAEHKMYPDRDEEKQIKFLKLTVLLLMCIGLGAFAIYVNCAKETELVCAIYR